MKKILIFILSLTFLIQITGNWATAFAAEERQVIDIAGLPVKGPANASVTIIVFSARQQNLLWHCGSGNLPSV
jgi:hypothetical protein